MVNQHHPPWPTTTILGHPPKHPQIRPPNTPPKIPLNIAKSPMKWPIFLATFGGGFGGYPGGGPKPPWPTTTQNDHPQLPLGNHDDTQYWVCRCASGSWCMRYQWMLCTIGYHEYPYAYPIPLVHTGLSHWYEYPLPPDTRSGHPHHPWWGGDQVTPVQAL